MILLVGRGRKCIKKEGEGGGGLRVTIEDRLFSGAVVLYCVVLLGEDRLDLWRDR